MRDRQPERPGQAGRAGHLAMGLNRSAAVLVALVVAVVAVAVPAAGVPRSATEAPTGIVAAAYQAATVSVPAGKRPRAVVSATYAILASGKVQVTVASNASKVQVKYRTAGNKKRSSTKRIRTGVAVVTLPARSKGIAVRAKATKRLAASRWAKATPVVAATPMSPTPGTPDPTATPSPDASQPTVTPSPTLAPVISSVNPNAGLVSGGAQVTLTGSNLATVSRVMFGGTAAADLAVSGSSTLTVTTPAHDAGAVDVALIWSGGTVTQSGAFTYKHGDTLVAGESLRTGEYLSSASGNYTLIMQSDCNLVVYRGGGVAGWNSGTVGAGSGCHADMQSDGNLVVYTASRTPVWSSTTSGFSGTHLSLQDDGNLVLYQNSRAIWSNGGSLYDRLPAGWTLRPGESLTSIQRQYQLIMQADGNLVVYKIGGAAQWSTATGGSGNWAVMQTDGNFVVYSSTGSALWNSSTGGHSGAYVLMQDDGNLVVYQGSSALWVNTSSAAIDVFVANNKGKTLANAQGTYPGECVSLVSQFLLQVFGITTSSWGNAIDYRNGGSGGTQMALRGFTWHTDTSFRNGDIIVWGDDAGSTTGAYGHIAVWYNSQILDQNWAGRTYAGLHSYFSSGYLGYWRK